MINREPIIRLFIHLLKRTFVFCSVPEIRIFVLICDTQIRIFMNSNFWAFLITGSSNFRGCTVNAFFLTFNQPVHFDLNQWKIVGLCVIERTSMLLSFSTNNFLAIFCSQPKHEKPNEKWIAIRTGWNST